MSPADNLCNQFGPRSGSKLFANLMVLLKVFFLKMLNFEEKYSRQHKTMKNYPECKELIPVEPPSGGTADATILDKPLGRRRRICWTLLSGRPVSSVLLMDNR